MGCEAPHTVPARGVGEVAQYYCNFDQRPHAPGASAAQGTRGAADLRHTKLILLIVTNYLIYKLFGNAR